MRTKTLTTLIWVVVLLAGSAAVSLAKGDGVGVAGGGGGNSGSGKISSAPSGKYTAPASPSRGSDYRPTAPTGARFQPRVVPSSPAYQPRAILDSQPSFGSKNRAISVPNRAIGVPNGGINFMPVADQGGKPIGIKGGDKPSGGIKPRGGTGIAPGERVGKPIGIPGGFPQGNKPGPGGIAPGLGKPPVNPDFGKPITPGTGKPGGIRPGGGKPGPGGLIPGTGKPPSGPGTGGPLVPGGTKFPGTLPNVGKTGPIIQPGGIGKVPSPIKPDGAIMPGEVKKGWVPNAGKPEIVTLPDKSGTLIAKAGGPAGMIAAKSNHGILLPPLPPPPPLPGVSTRDYWRSVHHHYDHDADFWFGGHHSWRSFIHGCAPAPWFWNYYPYYYTSPWVFGYYSPSVYASWGWGVPYWYGRAYYPWWDWCDAPFVYYYYRYPSRFSFTVDVGPATTVAYADAGAADVIFERPLGVWVPGHYEGDAETGDWVWIPGYYTY